MADDTVMIAVQAVDDATATFKKVSSSLDKLDDKIEDVEDSLKDADAASGGFNRAIADSGGAADASQRRFMQFGLTLSDVQAGFDLVEQAAGTVKEVFEQTVGTTVEYAKQVRDLSRAIGANAEESSALIQVADDVGVEVSTLEAAFKAAIKNGIQPNIEGLSRLSDEYNSIQDPVQRSQFLLEKFGRAGLDMGKLLEQGGESIREAAEEARKLGLTLDDKAVKAAREFEIHLDDMGDKLEAVKLKIGKGVLPALNDFFDTLSTGLDVVNATQVGLGGLDEKENELAATVARNVVLSFGQQTDAVIRAQDELRNYLMIRQQVGMTDNEAALRANMAAAATAEAARSTAEKAAQDNAARDAAQQHTAVMKEYSNELLYAVQQSQAKAAADEAAARADAIYRAGISETIGKVDSMAQSLKTATDAQAKQILAQAQLDALKKAFEEGTISQEGFNRATDAVLLRYDLATPKSLAMAEAQQKITEAFIAGDVPLNDYILAADKIPGIAEDGKVTMQELTELGLKPATEATRDQTTALGDNATAIDEMTKAWGRVPKEVETKYKITVEGEVPQAPAGGGKAPAGKNTPGFATGANFVVPPGYPNDSYYMRVSTGERVTVQPKAQQQRQTGGSTITNNNITNVYNPLAARMLADQRLRERLDRSNARMGV